MISSLIRKARKLQADPVLRRWLIERALGRQPAEPAFTPGRPSYLDDLLPLAPEVPSCNFKELPDSKPKQSITLELAAKSVVIDPGSESDIFEQTFDDIETRLSVHRFAWLPLARETIDPAWVNALWRAWMSTYANPSDDWPWHPYTAAERAINILNFARQYGLPGERQQTLDCLAAHAPAIAGRLEYFGDHHTSNHLANNGRGLFALGLTLGLESAAQIGETILLAEAERIVWPSGMLREGSSHYHLLVTRNYLEAWLSARRQGHSSAPALQAIACKMLVTAPVFHLPGGLALVGDISPDCPPAYLESLLSGQDNGWVSRLDNDDRGAFFSLREEVLREAPDTKADGWTSAPFGNWSALWHVAPEGWSHMPGHGHQDVGSFELHYGDQAVIVDPGRDAYGDLGDAERYRSGEMHNGLRVDGADPYPPNRPYFSAAYREKVCGQPPRTGLSENDMTVCHSGFSRLKGVGDHERSWHFKGDRLVIADILKGTRRHGVTRTLISPLKVTARDNHFILHGVGVDFRISCANSSVSTKVVPVTRWLAYGRGVPANALVFTSSSTLPFDGEIRIEAEQGSSN